MLRNYTVDLLMVADGYKCMEGKEECGRLPHFRFHTRTTPVYSLCEATQSSTVTFDVTVFKG